MYKGQRCPRAPHSDDNHSCNGASPAILKIRNHFSGARENGNKHFYALKRI